MNRLIAYPCMMVAVLLTNSQSWTAETRVKTVMVAMRDGVQLATDIYRNPAVSKQSVILVRTPYNKDRAKQTAKRFVEAGYTVVIQDCRGTHGSEGVLIPYNNEGQDGYDTIEWIGQQSWSNGRIGTWGSSYVGAVQWQAAVENPPGLVTMIPRATWSNFYRNLYLGGAVRMLISPWAASQSDRPEGVKPPTDWEAIYMHLPISETDQKIGWSIPWLKAIFMHPEPNGYWDRLNLTDQITDLEMPIQHMVGYYDFFSRESVGNFVRMREHARKPTIRQQQQLILGPWDHGTIGKSQVGEVDFGPAARLDTIATSIAWYDQYLKPSPSAGTKPPVPVRYFVMGENTWHEAQTWPPAGFSPASFYLGSSGKANTRSGDGQLLRSPPEQAKPSDTFRADPANPTPACPVTEQRSLSRATWAPVDQRPIEDRQDVLVYTSPKIVNPITFAGNARAELFVSADTPDADWVVKVVDVHPNGFAQNLAVGILRGRYRDSELNPTPLTPGQVYRITVDLGPVAATIQKNHHLRVDICGAYFPLFDRNTNTGEGPTGKATKISTEKVYHRPGQWSRIILPCASKETRP